MPFGLAANTNQGELMRSRRLKSQSERQKELRLRIGLVYGVPVHAKQSKGLHVADDFGLHVFPLRLHRVVDEPQARSVSADTEPGIATDDG